MEDKTSTLDKFMHIYNLDWMQNFDVEEEKNIKCQFSLRNILGPSRFPCKILMELILNWVCFIRSPPLWTILAQSFVRAIRLYRHLWYLNSFLWNFLELRKTAWYVKLINLNLLKSFIGENKSYIVSREIYDGKL